MAFVVVRVVARDTRRIEVLDIFGVARREGGGRGGYGMRLVVQCDMLVVDQQPSRLLLGAVLVTPHTFERWCRMTKVRFFAVNECTDRSKEH